jgi:hypothetical protein
LGFLQEFTEPRNFLQAKIMTVRPLEEGTLAADAEHKFSVSTRLDITQMFDKFYGLAPAEVMGQLTVEKILVQRFEALAHLTSPLTKV